MNPMHEEPAVYHAYLLRLWRTQCQGQPQWRASLESPHTGEHQSFASLEQCFAYLSERFGPTRDAETRGCGGTETGRYGEPVSKKKELNQKPINRSDTQSQ